MNRFAARKSMDSIAAIEQSLDAIDELIKGSAAHDVMLVELALAVLQKSLVILATAQREYEPAAASNWGKAVEVEFFEAVSTVENSGRKSARIKS